MITVYKPQGELSIVSGITIKWVFSCSVFQNAWAKK